MLFKTAVIPGIIYGSITLTFRVWKKPQARAGGRYRFGPDDVLVADAVTLVRAGTISDADARRSGFDTATKPAQFAQLLRRRVVPTQFHRLLPDERLGARRDRRLRRWGLERASYVVRAVRILLPA